MMPNYRDGWTVGKTDYMIYAPKGAKMGGKVFIRGRKAMRLIDADSLLKYLFVTESRTGGSVYAQAYEHGWDDALKAVMENEPTVADVAEVVRCKDCRWFGEYGCAIRIVDDSDKPKENDFCSFAERREDV